MAVFFAEILNGQELENAEILNEKSPAGEWQGYCAMKITLYFV